MLLGESIGQGQCNVTREPMNVRKKLQPDPRLPNSLVAEVP
jgi:hypothetical protein